MNHSLNTGLRGSNRDIGLHTGAAGKGDKSRVTDEVRYQRNLEQINFPGVKGLVRKNGRLVKTYPRPGATSPAEPLLFRQWPPFTSKAPPAPSPTSKFLFQV